jgi:hypothetical protein
MDQNQNKHTEPTTPASSAEQGATVAAVRHWHVTESNAGYLPEAEPTTTVDAESALDALAHLLKDWAAAVADPDDPDAVYAEALSERYCTCRQGERSAEHHDATTAVEEGKGICEQINSRVFELVPCQEKDCLKYCPDAECGTVTPVTDSESHCWCCGARYVDRQTCGWL